MIRSGGCRRWCTRPRRGARRPPRVVEDFFFDYDLAGRIEAATSLDGAASFGYDDGDQLLAATYSFPANETYAYGLAGNRTNAGYATGAGNRLVTRGQGS